MADGPQEMMSLFEAESHSFVLRLWREHGATSEAAPEWRGWVEHVQTGQRYYFRDFTDIKRIVAECLDEPHEAADQLFEPIQTPQEDE